MPANKGTQYGFLTLCEIPAEELVSRGEMPRLARVVVPDVPHHVTQRGNRKQETFFRASDYGLYKELIARWCARWQVAVWAYCLMPNHVHLILTPRRPEGLARAVGEAHRRYTLTVNRREGWKGYLWQGRFASFPMDSAHLLNAVRYVLLNPVRAGLVKEAEEWPHSSVQAHLTGRSEGVIDPAPLASRIKNWAELLQPENDTLEIEAFRRHQRTGRPMGSEGFVRALEALLGRPIRPRKPGRRMKAPTDVEK